MCLLREERLCWRRLGFMDYSYNRVVEVPEERERLLIAQSALKHGQRDEGLSIES
jgi:hypothetical protein